MSPAIVDISHGQRGSTESNALQWKSNVLQCPRYSAPPLLHEIASEGIWTPNQKVWGSVLLPSRLTHPYDIKCIKHIYT